MSGLLFLVLGVALSAAIIPLAIRVAPALGMVDEPDPRKVHARPIPRIGGIGIVVGSLGPVVALMPMEPLLQSFIIGSLILFVFGAWDDAAELTHWVKFGGQFAAAAIVVYHGNLWVERFPFLNGEPLSPEIGKPFTIFALVGVINAINHSDGLDGLAGGESLLGLIVMGFLAFVVDDSFGVFLSCAVAGGILGFLRFNTHPARIFMGDSGSQFLGYTMGFLAVYLTQVSHPALSPALPLLLIGLPIADINAVFYLRISGGMNWFRATRNHIHHRLLDRGFEHYETVIIIYSVQALLVGLGALLRYESDLVVTGTFLVIVASLFLVLTYLERKDKTFHTKPERRALNRFLGAYTGGAGPVARFAEKAAVWGYSSLLLLAALASDSTSPFVGIISAALLLSCLLVLVLWKKTTESLVFRFATYAVSLSVVYLLVQDPPQLEWLDRIISTPAFLVLGVILAAAIRLSSERVFKTTATDYLILFGLITISIFGREQLEVRQITTLVVHSVVMIYASEFACRATTNRISVLSLAVIASLSLLTWRAL